MLTAIQPINAFVSTVVIPGVELPSAESWLQMGPWREQDMVVCTTLAKGSELPYMVNGPTNTVSTLSAWPLLIAIAWSSTLSAGLARIAPRMGGREHLVIAGGDPLPMARRLYEKVLASCARRCTVGLSYQNLMYGTTSRSGCSRETAEPRPRTRG